MIWFAVMTDAEDTDWGYGSYCLDKAKEMVRSLGGDAYIAVIDEDCHVCIDEIRPCRVVRWWLVDECDTNTWTDHFSSESAAVNAMIKDWCAMSESEKKKRNDFYVGCAESDPWDIHTPNWDTMTDVTTIKEALVPAVYYAATNAYNFIAVTDDSVHVFVENNRERFPQQTDFESKIEFRKYCEEWLKEIAPDLDTTNAGWDEYPLSMENEILFADDVDLIAGVEI